MSLNVLEGFSLCFWHEKDNEKDGQQGQDGVHEESSGEVQNALEIHESFDYDEPASVAERGGHGTAETTKIDRVKFADQEQRDRADSQGICHGEENYACDGEPVQMGVLGLEIEISESRILGYHVRDMIIISIIIYQFMFPFNGCISHIGQFIIN